MRCGEVRIAIDRPLEPLFDEGMQRLTPIEWGRAKGPIAHLSLPDRGPIERQRIIRWLEARPGNSWFYVSGDTFHFGSQVEATAFRAWLFSQPLVG